MAAPGGSIDSDTLVCSIMENAASFGLCRYKLSEYIGDSTRKETLNSPRGSTCSGPGRGLLWSTSRVDRRVDVFTLTAV